MKIRTIALALVALTATAHATAQVTFYENEGYEGRSFTTQEQVRNFQRRFNDRASSAVVTSNRWEVCADADFGGRCVVLRRGNYPSLAAMGLDDRVSSVRAVGRQARVDDERYAPSPLIDRDYRRRGGERLYQADVTSVRAVMGPPETRCWADREQVPDHGRSNVPGAVVGAVLGGILGHQVGGGSGKQIATVGGAVAGGAIGARTGRDDNGRPGSFRDFQRCSETAARQRPDHWDVTYHFRGQEHRVQMTAPPGQTVTVNRDGEPRA
ncbi:glycine zipper 2TM domain-containing protein [Aquincola sp. S2]|uniref:Glycine zipper 2TM domain-containing protein n=1 Tax=Pseudaquabacterium terrae TaxID=2732868 RepID=A0ABX2EET4_9BURK|nr:beta/gamma crystallin-related protein [Aquabacterium terrae]NRF67119.1 glycine zipper 2TM domain-containing protein [Aquabacterium terrae]